MKNNMKKLLPLALLCACSLSAAAQTTFTVASYNIDGLGEIINSDGPGEEGTKAISARIAEEGWDFFGVCEDFKYDEALRTNLTTNYAYGTFRTFSAWDYGAILTGGKLNTDGLNLIWKREHKAANETMVAWTDHKGGILDQANDCIDKGFRYYTMTLNNVVLDVYILHMEAGGGFNQDDKVSGYYNSGLNDHSKNGEKQLTQLVNYIKATDNNRPIIIMGDTNCRYTRENVKGLLIDALNADERFTANDCWIEYCRGGVYPANPSASLKVADLGYVEGEVVDKIIYVNNKNAICTLSLDNFKIDETFVKEDGTKLADHFPAVATFSVTGKDYQNKWEWTGEEIQANTDVYLYNVGYPGFVNSNGYIVKPENANTLWQLTGTTSGYVLNGKNFFYINNLGGIGIANSGINNGDRYKKFNFIESTTTDGAYKFKSANFNRYFNATGYNNNWSRAENPGKANDFLLVYPEQMRRYNEYLVDFEKAKELLNTPGIPEEVYKEIDALLDEPMNMDIEPDFHDYVNGTSWWYDATITPADYSTLCLPWNATVPAGVTVYYGTNFNNDGDMLNLEELNGKVLPKNTGVVLYSDVDESTTYRFWRTLKPAAGSQPANILLGTNSRIEAEHRDQDNYSYYALSNKSKGVGFYVIDDTRGVAIPANRAYLMISKAASSVGNAIIFTFDEENIGGTTAIDNVATDENEASIEAIYNASGARIGRLQQGVNIIRMSNGAVKKVFVK